MWGRMKRQLWRQTSVRQNLSANLASRVLAILVSLACVPIYLRVLGIGGYGLIGIWTTLETFASLLDLGVSPTITRELAASTGRAKEAQDARDLVRTLEVAYWAVGFAIGGAIVLGASSVATYWLRSSQSSASEIQGIVTLIGVLVLCRWPLTFYSGGLTGLERQVLLSWGTLVFTCIRSLGAVLVLLFISPTVFAFFIWQIGINLVQTAVFAGLLWRCMPPGSMPRFRTAMVRRVWKFASGMTAVALVSILLTDLDKLVVSGLSSLEDFGYYALGSRIAGTLYMPASAVYSAMLPALARRAAAQNEKELADLYHRGCQVMSVLVLPLAITAIFFAKPALFAWTGNAMIADRAWFTTALLIGGAAFMCVRFTPGALQLAVGWTSLALWTNVVYAVIMVPLLVILTKRFGGAGAAAVWLVSNVSYLATQVPLMHRRLLRHEARRWYVTDFGIPLVACLVTAALLAEVAGSPTTRLGAALTVVVAGVFVGVVGVLGTPLLRKQLGHLLPRKATP